MTWKKKNEGLALFVFVYKSLFYFVSAFLSLIKKNQLSLYENKQRMRCKYNIWRGHQGGLGLYLEYLAKFRQVDEFPRK